MKNKLLFLLIVIQASNIYSQILTDRPSQTDSPFVIEKGNIQIESGINIQEIQSDINSLIRIGIFDGFELRINSNYIINDEISFHKKSSFDDFEIGSKFRIIEKTENKFNISFLTYLSIPTAPEVFSYNEYGFLNKLLFSHNLTSDIKIGYNIGYNKFTSYDDLLKTNPKCIYITETIGHGSNLVTGDYSVGATGFFVEDGQFKYPINEITIAGNFKDMFKKIFLANDLDFEYSTNSPTMMIEGMTVAGK